MTPTQPRKGKSRKVKFQAIQETFGQRIARLLHDHGRRQCDLAQATNMHVTSVNKWINDGVIPRWPLMPGIATYFGLTLAQLVEGLTDQAQEAA